MATSSAIQLADLGLVWSNVRGDADAALIDSDLASDRGLLTAAVLSLFTDRRAEDDDQPPSGDVNDRRGWWADQFADVQGDRFGSRLWLLARSKRTSETVRRADEFTREALAWMLEDRVVESINISVDTVATAKALFARLGLPTDALLISGSLNRPGKDPVSFRFAHAWDHLEEDAG